MPEHEKTQRSNGPMFGYERIELTISWHRDSLFTEQWCWSVSFGAIKDSYTVGSLVAMGLEADEQDAIAAACLAREEIWELLR